ncbi:Ankyrin-3 [Tolypocladium ophioglossoides CBS 100239]|uniref:Ankyrin-3 n=1 Tax=Tolypocladium ophioglossoides (strain CBS 100239) TaxID=1163406 RepID=A0A0L0NFT0_TOLOC|nr:Ankyrin-3 [Tolypocladium ophioglossoides CBS 100239]
MGSSSDDLMEAFRRATEDLHICPNRVWAVAEEKLPKLLPTHNGTKHWTNAEVNSHESCTFDFCEYSQRDFTAVQQRHECKERNYMLLRSQFSRTILVNAASEGRSTVWSLAGNAMLEPHRPYMAVSHVWSDGTGTGAWRDGEVNECLYAFFQGIAKQFHCEGIWWDTLCIPRDKAARNKAIQNIQSNYQDARITLVHDIFLRNWDWCPETACFAILMSPWFSRGWTALELAKSRKVKVIFKGPRGPLIKDLDEHILAEENEPSSPRKEASRIIRNLRKGFTTLNDLLAVLRPRNTSWPKDRATISALLVGVTPEEMQQDTYKSILKKIGQVSPGHLFHNAATMSKGPSWCPTSLFSMPLDSSERLLTISDNGDLLGKWYRRKWDAKIGEKCFWDGMHPLIRRRIQDAFQRPEPCLLLAECGNARRALVVQKMQGTETLQVQYVGAVYFQDLAGDNWTPEEVIIHGSGNTGTGVWGGATHSNTKAMDKEEQSKSISSEMFRRAVWRGEAKPDGLDGLDELDEPDQLGQRPLHLAAERGDKLMVESLLRHKVDLHAQCKIGQTPLHRAAWGGSANVAKLLLREGSERTTKDTDGNIALHIAAQMGFEPVVQLFIEDKKSLVNAEGYNNLTPLHYATMNGHEEVAQLLMKEGAKLDAKDSAIGWTPLHCAVDHGVEGQVKFLVEHGADVNAECKFGWTPLHVAAMNGLEDVVRLLLGHKFKIKADKYGWTPRHFAEINGHSEVDFAA